MERMEHIRGKILEGEQTVLDPVDGYLACHDHKGRKTFYGYFEMPTEQLRPSATKPAIGWSKRRPESEHLHRDCAEQRRGEIGRRVSRQRRSEEISSRTWQLVLAARSTVAESPRIVLDARTR